MGLDYSIDLYFRVEDIEAALRATAAIGLNGDGKNIDVTLPNGKLLSLPFTSAFKTDPVTLNFGGKIDLDTALTFPGDPAIDDYFRNIWNEKFEKQAQYHLGMIYLHITCGQQYVCFAYTAATSNMSRLFLASQSIKETFLRLLNSVGGIFGLVNIEKDYYYLLENPALTIVPNPALFDYTELIPSTDVFVSNALQVKKYEEDFWKRLDNPVKFYQKWLAPFTSQLYYDHFIHNIDEDEQNKIATVLVKQIALADDRNLELLFADANWRSSWVAAWIVAVTLKEHFLSTVGKCLIRDPYSAYAFILVLVRFKNEESVRYLKDYIDRYLDYRLIDLSSYRYLTTHWALAALQLIDREQGTNNAFLYLEPGGLWDTFVQKGIDDILDRREYQELFTKHPNWLPISRREWFMHWDLDLALEELELAIEFVEGLLKPNAME